MPKNAPPNGNEKLDEEIKKAFHDIKNPLTALKLKINLIHSLLKKDEHFSPGVKLQEMLKSTDRDIEKTLKELDGLRAILIRIKAMKN